MKKILLLSVIVIFSCSGRDDSSYSTNDNNDNNNNDNNNSELLNCYGSPVPTIVYGTQEWTVENACHITYRDGTPIPEVTGDEEWANLTTGAWCYYDNDPTKPRLYNWYAVMGIYDEASLNNPSSRKEFAPEGWHIPSDNEWTILEEYLIANGYNYDESSYNCSPCSLDEQNKIAKAMSSSTGWNTSSVVGGSGNDQSLNNSSGFNAFPDGGRFGFGLFFNEGDSAIFWSYTDIMGGVDAWSRYLYGYYSNLRKSGTSKPYGISVRLVKD